MTPGGTAACCQPTRCALRQRRQPARTQGANLGRLVARPRRRHNFSVPLAQRCASALLTILMKACQSVAGAGKAITVEILD